MGNVSTAEQLEPGPIGPQEQEAPGAEPLGLAPEPVEVHRNAGVAALVGGVASAVAIAYLARATGTGSPLDWALAVGLGLLGIGHLAALVDARTPLLVADTQGVRVRLGHTWRGLPWGALARVEHRPRTGLVRDGRLVMVVRNPERFIEEMDRSGRAQTRISRRLYGAPFAVPLALSTRVSGAGTDLTGALAALAGAQSTIVEIGTEVVEVEETRPEEDPQPGRRWHDPRPALAHAIYSLAGRRPWRRDEIEDDTSWPIAPPEEEVDEDGAAPAVPVASPTPSPMREPVSALRAEVRTSTADEEGDELSGRELRRPGSVNLVEDTQVWGDRVSPISRPGHAVEPLLIDDVAVEPAEDPVVGPELLAARTRLGLTVDQLADRTRIRPHVIESIEVDDFAPCGGDFYARGHLRTLARVLGVDVAPLLTAYDERYASAPINPRRVFEAELATGSHGSIRGTRGGPNWSVLVAAVMALVLAWSVARLIMDSPVELRGTAPVLNGSAGVDNGRQQLADPVPLVLSAAGGGARVMVRDGAGELVFDGELAFGQTKTLRLAPPVRIQTSDGSLEVTLAGQPRGAIGTTGQPAQNTFVAE